MRFLFYFCPLVRIGRRVFALDDRLPDLRELSVKLNVMALILRHIVFGIDRLYRTFRDAERAVYTLVWLYDEKVGSFAKTIDRAHVHTVGIFTLNAGFGDDISHVLVPSDA